jgi:hypothetical protein
MAMKYPSASKAIYLSSSVGFHYFLPFAAGFSLLLNRVLRLMSELVGPEITKTVGLIYNSLNVSEIASQKV